MIFRNIMILHNIRKSYVYDFFVILVVIYHHYIHVISLIFIKLYWLTVMLSYFKYLNCISRDTFWTQRGFYITRIFSYVVLRRTCVHIYFFNSTSRDFPYTYKHISLSLSIDPFINPFSDSFCTSWRIVSAVLLAPCANDCH